MLSFNADGQWILAGPVPGDPSLLGHNISFRSLAQGPIGFLIDTSDETVFFQ